jgi:hypothetical protein
MKKLSLGGPSRDSEDVYSPMLAGLSGRAVTVPHRHG